VTIKGGKVMWELVDPVSKEVFMLKSEGVGLKRSVVGLGMKVSGTVLA
jgi:hypothetical protein